MKKRLIALTLLIAFCLPQTTSEASFRKSKEWGIAKPPVGAQVDWGNSISRGLVGYWMMSEGAGNKIYDISKLNHGALTSGPTWAAGRFARSINFDGTDDHIVMPAPAVTTYPLTMSAWVKLSNAAMSPNEERAIVSVVKKSGVEEFWVEYYRTAGGVYQIRLVAQGGGNLRQLQCSITTDTKWHYIVAVFINSTNFFLYYDGVSVSGAASGTAATPTGLDTTYISGFYYNTSTFYAQMPGIIDNVRIYNRALTHAEIRKLYTEPFAGIVTPKLRIRSQVQTSGIVFDSASNSGYQAASSSYSWSHTSTGSDRYLTVGIAMLSLAQTVTSITYNGVNLSLLGTQASVTGAARVELWGLVSPATGSNTIAVTLSGAIASAGNASSYTNVNQTSPTEAFNSAQATNVGAADATVNVTTVADNDWTVDIVATDDAAITVGAGQTQAGNVTGAGGSGAMSYEGPKTPAGSVTMSWANVGALATWATGSVALRPVGSSSLKNNSGFFLMFE